MSLPNRPPASIRYFKARFRLLTRFSFWISIASASLLGFVGWAAWQHPEWLVQTEDGEKFTVTDLSGETRLTSEDNAIAADIDSVSVLLQQIDNAEEKSSSKGQTAKTESLFDEYIRKQTAAAEANKKSNAAAPDRGAASENAYNPFGQPLSSNPFSAGGAYSVEVPAGVSAGGSASVPSTEQNPKSAPVNPLQAALDRYLGDNSNPNSENQTPTDRERQNTQNTNDTQRPDRSASGVPGQTSGTYPDRGNPGPIPGQTSGSTSPYSGNAIGGQTYGTYPSSGTPGYSVPPGTNPNPANSYAYPPSQTVPTAPQVQPLAPQIAPVAPSSFGQSAFPNATSGTGVTNPGVNSNFANPGLQPSQIQPVPFSVPRPIPGRYIGGGRIDSFSNP